MLASESPDRQGYSHYHTLFQKWAKDDPDAAIAKLNLIKGTSNRQQALQGIAMALVTSDPKRALDMLEGMPPGQNRVSMLSSITSAWMSHDSDAAIAWINSLPAADQVQGYPKWQLPIDPGRSRQGGRVFVIASRKQPDQPPVFAIWRASGRSRISRPPESGWNPCLPVGPGNKP